MAKGKVYKLTVDKRKLELLPEEAHTKLGQVIAKVAFDIQSHTQANIRKHDLIDTGNMLNSVAVLDLIEDKGFTKWVVIGADYAIYHELGTFRLPAKHMLGEAVENNRQGFYRAVAEVFKAYE